MKGKAEHTTKRKLGRETKTIVVQKDYATRQYERGIAPPRSVLKSLFPWLFGR